MNNPLDNPVWSAMTSGNNKLAFGSDRAKLFPEDLSPFAGLKDLNESCFDELYDQLRPDRIVAVVSADNLGIPANFQLVRQVDLFQMTGEHLKMPAPDPGGIIPLESKHIPQMLALTKLTNPGPFLQRTIEFGHYTGFLEHENLLSMAGRRMHIHRFIEISAVCTQPDETGKGYGSRLIKHHIRQIMLGGNIPFLHVTAENENAIALYQKTGFAIREKMHLYLIRKTA